jgi:hypothetical protein
VVQTAHFTTNDELLGLNSSWLCVVQTANFITNDELLGLNSSWLCVMIHVLDGDATCVDPYQNSG